MEGVSFTLEDFHSALHVYNLNSEIGARVKGTIFMTDNNGALADITAKSSAYLRAQEASVHRIKAPERSWQFQAEDAIVKGFVAVVERLTDFQAQLGIGPVITGIVQSLKPYGTFIDIGRINGLLHVS
ncbi:hypothetical protein OIU78_002253 [Salix suchowensis]|nr:hypothetical protein OIU78_002253 [Salix suchowensis]